MEIQKRKRNLDMGIITLWLHWTIATGALLVPQVLGIWIAKSWLPIISLIEAMALYYYIQNSAVTAPRCYLIVNICARALILSALVMIVINYFYSSGRIYRLFDEQALNVNIPFITTLIVAPSTLLMALLAVVRDQRQSFCRNCVRRYGSAAERGFIGGIYKREGYMQAVILSWLSGVTTVYTWLYYTFFYINVNINNPDIVVFAVVPVMFYLASLVYTALRYFGLLSYYSLEVVGSARQRGAITELRFIMVHDDSVFIGPSDPQLSNSKLDTPFSLTVKYRKEVPDDTATDYFCNLAHVTTAQIKYLYTSESGNLDGTILHYAAIIPNLEEFDADVYPEGRWHTFYQLKQMVNNKELAPLLRAELVRVYTIAMAWKTYDRNGKRLYKVKHYRPTFHLSQLPKLDVDFNDNRWLFVAANNEDRRFFRTRRLVKKLLFGRDI